MDVFGSDVFNFSAPVDFTFTAGDTFFVLIENNTGAADADAFSLGGFNGPPGNGLVSFNQGPFTVVPSGAEIDFRLISASTTVPEPGSTFVFLLGAAGFGLIRRRSC